MSIVLKEPKKTSTSSFKAINCEKPTCKHNANKGLAQNCCASRLEFVNYREWTVCSANLLYNQNTHENIHSL